MNGGQALIRQKHREYRINVFLDYVEQRNWDVGSIIEGKNRFIGIIPGITEQDIKDYMAMLRQPAIEFLNRYPEVRGWTQKEINEMSDKQRQEMFQIERNATRQFLLTHDDLFKIINQYILY